MGLRELLIKNFVFIKNADIEFSPGLNVITGETGAGKTLILKAIEFALGARVDKGFVKGDSKGSVTLLLEIYQDLLRGLKEDLRYDSELIVKREIDKNGKTKMFINGDLAPQLKAREVFLNIFEFHGQFSSINLLNRKYQTQLYDEFLGKDVVEIKKSIREKIYKLRELEIEKENIGSIDNQEEMAYLREQIREFEELRLDGDTEERLREEEKILKNAQEISEATMLSYNILYGDEMSVISMLSQVERLLGRISNLSSNISDIARRISTITIEIEDISRELYDFRERLFIDNERLDEIEEYLSKISSLKRKYRLRDTMDILSYVEDLKKKLLLLIERERAIEEVNTKIREIKKQLMDLSVQLYKKRYEKKQSIEEKIEEEIRTLGISYAKFRVNFIKNSKGVEVRKNQNGLPIYITEDGSEVVEFLFSANPDRKLDTLSKIASGGELSRVMLAIKSVLSQNSHFEKILLFDEIDQGIGERLGDIIGKKLKELSKKNQVIVVTHLSQIARMADTHIFVKKSFAEKGTHVSVQVLSNEERKKELLRMLGGESHISFLRRV